MHRCVSPPPLYTHTHTDTHSLTHSPTYIRVNTPNHQGTSSRPPPFPTGPQGVRFGLLVQMQCFPHFPIHTARTFGYSGLCGCVCCARGSSVLGASPRRTCSRCDRALGKHVCPMSPAQKDSKVGRAAFDTQEESCLTVLLARPILKDMPIRYP